MLIYFTQVIADEDDRQFMTDLFLSYEKYVYHELWKYSSDPWTIEDLFQTVFVKLIDKIPTLRSLDKPRLTRYISVTAKNTAINHLHRNKKIEFVAYDEAFGENVSSPDSVEDIVFAKDRVQQIMAAWEKLDPQSQYYLDARYTLEKSAAEIAADLGVPAVNVRMGLSRARRKLRDLL